MEKLTVGKFIASLRKSAQLTQSALAEKLQVSAKTVSKWECDEGLPDIGTLPALAKELGVTIEELLQGQRSPSPDQTAQSVGYSPDLAVNGKYESGGVQGVGIKADNCQNDCSPNRALKYENRFKVLTLISIGLCLLAAALILFTFTAYSENLITALIIVSIVLAIGACVLFAVNIVSTLTVAKELPLGGKTLKSIVFGWSYSLITVLALSITAAALKLAADAEIFTVVVRDVGANLGGFLPAAQNDLSAVAHIVRVWQPFLIMYAVSLIIFNLRYVLRRLLVKQGVIAVTTSFKSLKFNLIFAVITIAANVIIWFILTIAESADLAFSYIPLWLTVFQAIYAVARAAAENKKRLISK